MNEGSSATGSKAVLSAEPPRRLKRKAIVMSSSSSDDDDIASSGCLSLRGLSITSIPEMFFGEGGTLAPGLEGTITVGLDGKSSGASSPITHLWLDGNPFGISEAGIFDGLSSIMARAAPTVEEISLCHCKIGDGKDDAASAKRINDALFAADGVSFKRLVLFLFFACRTRLFPHLVLVI